ncbi:hypothetical protein B0H14DRAFT_1002149 [Mycena olivaceomarginata]|nr:hypothetical protein B0H14DRAFT_1002149 [Mycena olivaceomarginata]
MGRAHRAPVSQCAIQVAYGHPRARRARAASRFLSPNVRISLHSDGVLDCCLPRLAAWRRWIRPDAASNAPQYALCFVPRWGHDRKPRTPARPGRKRGGSTSTHSPASSPSPQASSRRHCRIPCTKLLAHLLPLLLHILVAHSVFPAARVLRGGVASPRSILPRVGVRTALGSLTPPLHSCACVRRSSPPARLHAWRRASARPDTALFLPTLPNHVPPFISRCGVLPRRRESCILCANDGLRGRGDGLRQWGSGGEGCRGA